MSPPSESSFYDYLINQLDGSIAHLRETTISHLSTDSLTMCTNAMTDTSLIARVTKNLLSVGWSTEPTPLISVWRLDFPIRISCFLETSSQETLRRFHRVAHSIYSTEGVECSPSWIDLVVDFPCVVTMLLEFEQLSEDDVAAQVLAGELIRNWAGAWFQSRGGVV